MEKKTKEPVTHRFNPGRPVYNAYWQQYCVSWKDEDGDKCNAFFATYKEGAEFMKANGYKGFAPSQTNGNG